MDKPAAEIVTTKDLLLRIKAKHNLQSTYALCKLMGENRRSIDRYLSGDTIKKASVMITVARLLDADLSWVAYNIMAEEAENDGEHDVARSFAETAQLYATTGLAISACLCLFFSHLPPLF
ncbi:hypothetical protein [Endozoicomonas atrinae]|uniref:hypothetical protein n=1 Tax=Endozoicomonas atrinae TaxID=1333660 RepID=UPI000825AD77|nr:hypothetical protein [Endozoicomonas atrinae]